MKTVKLSEESMEAIARNNEYESKNPNGTTFPFVRYSKDMRYVEIVVCGVGTIYKKKVGSRDPSIVMLEVEHLAKDYYRFPI